MPALAPPAPPTSPSTTASAQPCPPDGRLGEQDIARYREAGFLAFTGVLDPAEVEAARAGISEIVRRLADPALGERRAGGKAGTSYAGATYHSRTSGCFLQLEPSVTEPSADPAVLELQVRKLMTFEEELPVFHRLAHAHPRLRGLLDSLVGPGALLFQSLALVKPPFVGIEKPWHQDNAYFSVLPLDAVIGVWIALDEASPENGCMHVIPGGHHEGGLRHHHTTDCEIVPDQVDPSRAVPVPLPPGGALLFYGLLPHETPPNRSPHRRRAFQFHYRAAGSRIVDAEAYNAAYVDAAGQPASCRAAALATARTV